MPLLLLDLDNTLVDRSAAYLAWARGFAAAHGAGTDAVDWLVDADEDGYANRETLARRVVAELAPDRAVSEVLADIRAAVTDSLVLEPGVPAALQWARSAGWVPYLITNGLDSVQEHKMRLTGVDRLVDGWVVSDGVATRKPEPAIFAIAAERAGIPLTGAWMIGDTADADIAGAVAVGIDSVWLRRGRVWPEDAYAPTAVADSCAEAIDLVLTLSAQRSANKRVRRSLSQDPTSAGH